MSNTEQPEQTGATPGESPELKDLLLDLSFGPAWARKQPGAASEAATARHVRDSSPHREDFGRGRRPARAARPRPPRTGTREPAAFERRRRPAPPPEQRLPLSVSFLPAQTPLTTLVKQLRSNQKAYPVGTLASLFSSKPEFCWAKIEGRNEAAPPLELYQCKSCKAVALDRALLEAHTVKDHLEEVFEKREVQEEPPAGQFICVARCGLSGVLLGPPNHHSYAEKLQEVHRTRYPGMPIEAYRARVEMVRDPDLIERWRQEACRQTVFGFKDGKGRGQEPLSRLQAEAHFRTEVTPALIQKTRRAILPVAVALELEDAPLRALLRDMWDLELRRPRSLLRALRAALRNQHLHLFRVGKGEEHVSAVTPATKAVEHAVEEVRRLLDYLQTHPGCSRQQLLAHLLPDRPPDAPEAKPLLAHLTWLVGKGHLIEFFDGTLRAAAAHGQPSAGGAAAG